MLLFPLQVQRTIMKSGVYSGVLDNIVVGYK
jgi:hypothetical protein